MADIGQSYIDAIKTFEGFAPTASWDYKQHSNGYGTRALYPGETIDRDTAEQRFQAEIAKAAAVVDQIAPNAPPGARAALTSLTYNAGPGWTKAGLGDLVRSGNWDAAAQRLQEYNKAGGQINPGLQSRRSAEAAWFNAPMLGAGQPLPPVAQAAPVGLPLNILPQVAQAQPMPQQTAQSAPQNLSALMQDVPMMGLPPPRRSYRELAAKFQTRPRPGFSLG